MDPVDTLLLLVLMRKDKTHGVSKSFLLQVISMMTPKKRAADDLFDRVAKHGARM